MILSEKECKALIELRPQYIGELAGVRVGDFYTKKQVYSSHPLYTIQSLREQINNLEDVIEGLRK